MEKQQVIQELHRLRDLWNEINPLVDKRSHYDNNKKNAENRRNEELKKEYQYNSNIKSVKRLPTNNADLVEEEIMIRHRKDCIKAAKKKMAIASTVITLVTIACIALFIALPHISNIVNNNSAPYNFDSSSQNTSNSVANVFVSAVLFMLIQSGLLCFVGTAAFSVLKEESYKKVPDIGPSRKRMRITLAVIFGLPFTVTSVVTNPVGVIALIPIVALSFVLRPIVSKLDNITHPRPTEDEYDRLEKARANDITNQKANKAAVEKANKAAQLEFYAEKEKKIKNLDMESAKYNQDLLAVSANLSALTEQVKSDIVPDRDNNVKSIDKLLNYLENGRADSFKEALQLLDAETEREKDRETQWIITQLKLENDRFIASLDRDEAMRHNKEMADIQRGHNQSVRDKLDKYTSQIDDLATKISQNLDDLKKS